MLTFTRAFNSDTHHVCGFFFLLPYTQGSYISVRSMYMLFHPQFAHTRISKAMHVFRLTIFLCSLGTGIQDTKINGCTDGWVTMEDNTRQPILCIGEFKSAPAAWRILQADNLTLVFNESCGVPMCTFNGITLTTSDGTADLTIQDNRRAYHGFYVFCKETNVSLENGCRIRVEVNSSSAGTSIHTTSTAIENTTQLQVSTTSKTTTVDAASLTTTVGTSLPWAAIGGGVGAAVVIIIVIVIVIVIVKRRFVLRKSGGDNRNDAVEEHVNVLYEPGGQENKHTSTARHQPAINTTIAPSNDDYHLDDGEVNVGYTTVDLNPLARKGVNRSALGNVGMTHIYSVPAIRHDVALDETELTQDFDPNYSAVNAPRPKTFAAPSLTSTHGDEYAVVDKRMKGKKVATFQPEVYAQVNKPKPNPAGDVYAEVDKSSKRGNSQDVQQNVDSADGGYYAEVRKPMPGNKPTLAVKPVLKPKPTLQSNSAVNPDDGQSEQDEYNALNFRAQEHSVSFGEAKQQYSHISIA